MNQEQLDTLTELWCLTAQESIGDFELHLDKFPTTIQIFIRHKSIDNISLPCEIIRPFFNSKEKAKIVISLLEQIIENGDQWLRDEENYHGDKLSEKWDNEYKSNLEND